jgi:hypothetical protein
MFRRQAHDGWLQPVKSFTQYTVRCSKAYAQVSAGAGAEPARRAGHQGNAGMIAQMPA